MAENQQNPYLSEKLLQLKLPPDEKEFELINAIARYVELWLYAEDLERQLSVYETTQKEGKVVKVVYNSVLEIFICMCDFEDKGIPKAAGFRWNPEKKVWATENPETAANLESCMDKETRETLDRLRTDDNLPF